MIKLEFKGKFFTNTDGAVHVSDSYVQEMIDDAANRMINSSNENDFTMCATGDTMVFGFKCDEDEINIIVTQNYHEACLLRSKDNVSWYPIDWGHNCDEYDDYTREELIEEIRRLKNAEYNPRREI